MNNLVARVVGLGVILGTAAGASAARAQVGAGTGEALAQARAAMAGTRVELAGVRAGMAAAAAERRGLGWSRGLPAEPDGPPDPWIQADPGDSLYRSAREALNRGEPREAARLFQELRRRFPESGYVGDSYYYQAFALQRIGGERDLERGLELLGVQAEEHPDAPTRRDARTLRTRIQGMLARMGDEDAVVGIQSQATGACGEEDEDVRLMALNALLNMNAERAVPVLKEVLRSRGECSERLREKAVFLLSQKMTDETVEIMLDLAHRDPDPSPKVREAAVFWLSQVRSDEASAALRDILASSDDPRIQEKALFALSQRRDQGSLETLKDYAERTDVPQELREKAIFWLGQHSEAGTAYLRELYPTLGSSVLEEKVLFAVSQKRTEENQSWLLARARDRDEDLRIREKAIFWASQSGIEAGELRSIYDTLEDPTLKEKVIFGLSQQHSEEAAEALMDLARNEDDPRLREKAIFWLGQSDDPRVTEFLMELVRGGGGP